MVLEASAFGNDTPLVVGQIGEHAQNLDAHPRFLSTNRERHLRVVADLPAGVIPLVDTVSVNSNEQARAAAIIALVGYR
jgi:hypothetical protein